MNAFEQRIQQDCALDMNNVDLNIFQVNLGFKCNLKCTHCHLECSPDRQEMMSPVTMSRVIDAAVRIQPEIVDITGGAPELHPYFREFISRLREAGLNVQSRTNLTVLVEPGLEDIPAFFKGNQVQLVGSLPCYLEEEVCEQRGEGTYQKSLDALKKLNALGYGKEPDLSLSLVYNPIGPFLPPGQNRLEQDYKRELQERFDIQFSRLLTITNMPIGRFWKHLKKRDKLREYMELLSHGFNCKTIPDLMCRHQICVSWDGTLYDCDFNLALELYLVRGLPQNVEDIDPPTLVGRRVRTGDHCFGCTAGMGSSCGGALLSE